MHENGYTAQLLSLGFISYLLTSTPIFLFLSLSIGFQRAASHVQQQNTVKVLPMVLVELILQSPVRRSKPPTANITGWYSQSHPHEFGIIYSVALMFRSTHSPLELATLFPHL